MIQHQRGSSLIEVIVSIFLVGIIVIVFSASIYSIRLYNINSQRGQAYSFAQAQMETLKSYPFSELVNMTDAEFFGFPYDLGSWRVAAHLQALSSPSLVIVQPDTNGHNHPITSVLLLPQKETNAFTWQTSVRIDSESSGIWRVGLTFRYKDPRDYYFWGITPSALVFTRIQNGEETTLYQEPYNTAFQTWVQLEVISENGELVLLADEEMITTISDPDPTQDGHHGMMGWSDAYYYVDNGFYSNAYGSTTLDFDNDLLDHFPEGFIHLTPDLLDLEMQVTIQDHEGESEVKEILVEVIWTEKGEDKGIQLSSLRSAPYEP